MRKYRITIAIFLSALFLFLFSCRLDIPVKEMSTAKMQISRAVEVKAEKYAPDELKLAQDNLYQCHEAIKKEKKDDALKLANSSIQNANEAIEKSLPLLSKDSLDEAKKKYNEANLLYGDIASQELSAVNKEIDGADQLHKESKFWDSYLKSQNAIKTIASTVENKTVDLKRTAQEKLQAAEATYQKIEASGKKDYFKKEMTTASAHISRSKTSLGKEAYQESISASDEALNILNSIVIAMEKKSLKDQTVPDTKGKKLYVVKLNKKNRDCLWKIAFRMYKNAKLWPIIYMANKDKIKNPDLIFPGQSFIIPPFEKKDKKEAEIKPEKDLPDASKDVKDDDKGKEDKDKADQEKKDVKKEDSEKPKNPSEEPSDKPDSRPENKDREPDKK